MTRLLACGDLHLGKGSGLHPGRLGEQETAWRDVLKAARDEQVDAVLFAGDLWDKRRPTPEEYLAAERPLVAHREENGCPVLAINGNHDRAGVGEEMALDVLNEAGLIELASDPCWIAVGDTRVACLPWAPVSRLRARLGGDVTADELHAACSQLLMEIACQLAADNTGSPCVLLAHWSVDQAVLPSGMSVADLREVVLPLAELLVLGFDAIILGHIHAAQVLSDEPPVFYTGPPMPLDFGDAGHDHGYWLLDTVDAATIVLRFVPLDSPRFITVDTRAGDLDLSEDVDGAYVRVRIAATEDESRGIDARDVERWLTETLGARYARVEVQVARAARSRVESLDDQVDDAQAFGMWLEAQHDLDRVTGLVLTGMDTAYRERVAA